MMRDSCRKWLKQQALQINSIWTWFEWKKMMHFCTSSINPCWLMFALWEYWKLFVLSFFVSSTFFLLTFIVQKFFALLYPIHVHLTMWCLKKKEETLAFDRKNENTRTILIRALFHSNHICLSSHAKHKPAWWFSSFSLSFSLKTTTELVFSSFLFHLCSYWTKSLSYYSFYIYLWRAFSVERYHFFLSIAYYELFQRNTDNGIFLWNFSQFPMPRCLFIMLFWVNFDQYFIETIFFPTELFLIWPEVSLHWNNNKEDTER